MERIGTLYVLVDPKTHRPRVDSNLHPFPECKRSKHDKPIFRFI